jgi:peptide deformylase
VRALDENGQMVRVKAEGFLARIFQHEIDHTNGIMFVDHLKDHKDAFYKLTDDGKLEPLAYEEVEKSGVFQD